MEIPCINKVILYYLIKEKHLVDSAWFTNGKIKYKLKDDPRIDELKEWKDLQHIE